MTAPDLPPDVAAAEQQLAAYVALTPADQQQYDTLRAAVRRIQDHHDDEIRAAAYRDAADHLDTVANPHTERGAGVRWAAGRLRALADATAPES